MATRRTDVNHRSGNRHFRRQTGKRRRHPVFRHYGTGDGYRLPAYFSAIGAAASFFMPSPSRLPLFGLSATPAGPTGRCSHACLRLAFWLFCAPLFGLFFPAHRQKGAAFALAGVLAVALLVSFGWMFKSQPLVSASEAVPVKTGTAGEEQKNWEHWGNTTHGDRFAALDQINKKTISTSYRLPGLPIPAIFRRVTVPVRKTRIRRCRLAIRFYVLYAI